MEEQNRSTSQVHPAAARQRTFPLFRLFGAVLLTCLAFGYFSAPASARTTAASGFSIPRAAAPQGWSTVHYGGISLSVPSSWPVYDLNAHPERCVLFNIHAVYLGQQGTNAQCPVHAFGKTEALQLEPLETASLAALRSASSTTTVAGVPAKVNSSSSVDHTFVVVLKQVGVVIHLSYNRSPNLARRILGTLRLTGGKAPAPVHPASRRNAALSPAAEIAGVYQGGGFDTCAAPSTGAMSAWLSSPYRAVGIYIGGANRACGDGNLSSDWINNVTSSGWNLMPIYVGLQAPCANQGGLATIDSSQAFSEGTQAADDAANLAQGFGLGNGNLILNDMEAYNNSISSCSQAVMDFLNAWTQELHARGYLSGVYSSLDSGITDLINYAGSIYEPDTIWFANWDGVATTSDPTIGDQNWSHHQRIKQYSGGHDETWGGVTINIDSDQLDTTLYNGTGGGGGGSGVPAAPGASAAPTSIPTTQWWIDTFANAPGYRGGFTQVGTLYAGTNYVFCKEWGANTSDNNGNYNHYWLWTDLDTGGQGWVSAYYLSRWGNDQAMDNNGNVIPDCPT